MIERAGDAPSKSNRRTTRTPKRFFKPLTQTMPRIFHGLLCDKSDEFVKFEKMCGDPRRILLTCRLLSAKILGTHRFASIPKVAIMHVRLRQTRTKSRRHLSPLRKTRQAIFESLEHKYLMAFDSVAGVDYSRSLEVPSHSSSADYAPKLQMLKIEQSCWLILSILIIAIQLLHTRAN
jgi:hypothetical protein